MIDLPNRDKRKEFTRALLKSIAQATPISAVAAEFFGYLSPSDLENEILRWQEDITSKVNSHDELLTIHDSILNPPPIELIGVAKDLAIYFTQNSKKGMFNIYGYSDITKELPAIEKQALDEALHELEQLGLINISQSLNGISHISSTINLHISVDPPVLGNNPIEDAKTISSLMLNNEELSSIVKLEKHLGWDLRRLNPAIWYLKDVVLPENKHSKTLHPDYPTTSFIIGSGERLILKQFLNG
ncbi:hypothetical protein [Pseudodesulfovibrio indicus]|uniref:Uncharacterized protein n=1 Tax=Pseudodesulfovibrio indicus TaxID=1716143 RepID=A0AA94PLT5_9BACT|nr:hypothetical protein [Pseudodesulfovibrio indicus]TDT89082.1 hypothetical protein EDC59_10475 [Pseudodesulfovibrio indicus]